MKFTFFQECGRQCILTYPAGLLRDWTLWKPDVNSCLSSPEVPEENLGARQVNKKHSLIAFIFWGKLCWKVIFNHFFWRGGTRTRCPLQLHIGAAFFCGFSNKRRLKLPEPELYLLEPYGLGTGSISFLKSDFN